jgi:multidrug efflux pump subunit AcrB
LDYTIFTNSQFRSIPEINQIPLKAVGQSTVRVADVGRAEDGHQIQVNIVKVGLLLTGLMVLVFLGSLRATAAVFLSIPLSALAAFILLYFGGSSINTMILAGLALVFSRLIDNAVIVLENIFRHLEMGEPPILAAERGGEEVSMAVLAATLTSSAVFFPVTFLYGVSRFLFSALALAVVLALFASYFVACSVVPLFCAKFMKAPEHSAGDHGPAEADHGPAKAGHHVSDGAHAEPGSDHVETAGVSGFSRTPSFGERFNAAFAARFTRLLVWYERRVRASLPSPRLVVVGTTAIFLASLAIYPLLGVAFFPRTDAGQFVINLKSPTGSRIEMTTADVDRVEDLVRGVVDRDDLQLVTANIGVQPGFSSIYTSNAGPHTATMQVALKEDHRISSYDYMERTRRTIAKELPHLSAYFQNLLDLRTLPLHAARMKDPTALDAVTTITPMKSPTEIDHYQIQRVIDIYVNPIGEDLGSLAAGIDRAIAATERPAGVRVAVRGMVQGMRASFRSFALGLILALVLLYLILVAQFRSFVDPMLILLAVPTGLTGVLAALWLTGTTLNVQSLMGVLMMVGMVVSNSILIVEFTHRLEEHGTPLLDAVVNACRIRLRPIVMTSLATVIGLVPMALKLGTGSEAYAPLARAIIGGLIVSVALTVFIVPAAYLLVYRRRRPAIAAGETSQ